MTVSLVTDSAVEPLEVADLREYLRITHGNEDTLLATLIDAARHYCEDVTGRQFVNASWKITLDSFPTEILLYKTPISTVTHVKYYDTDNVQQTLVDGTDYETDTDSEPGRIREAQTTSWPSTYTRYDAVEVQFVAGYGAAASDVPEKFQQAIRFLAGHWYENRGPQVLGKTTADIKLTVNALLLEDRVWQFER